MIIEKRKMFAVVSAGCLLAACTAAPQMTSQKIIKNTQRGFETKSVSLNVKAEPSASPSSKSKQALPISTPVKNTQSKALKNFDNKKKALTFNNLDLSILDQAQPTNMVTVVYKSGSQVAAKTSEKATNSSSINTLLSKYKVSSVSDMTAGMSPTELLRDKSNLSNSFSGNIPNRSDIHTYKFPKEVNIRQVISELRSMKDVQSANPVLEEDISFSSHFVGRTSPTTTGIKPSDPEFDPNDENSWWWFNKQHILEAQDAYGSTAMPTIAVIDIGFDTTSSAIDKPNYLPGMSISNCSAVGVANCTVAYGNSNVGDTPNPVRDFSHGTIASVIIGAPKNNGEFYSGVAPGASILPIKKGVGILNTATAIREAAASNVDAISVSLSSNFNKCPTPYVSDEVRMEIASAVAGGTMVFYAAGNAGVDISDPANCGGAANNTGGAVIVGGAQHDTTVTPSRMSAWDGSGEGSNYTTQSSQIIHIAAAAKDIEVATYDPNTGNRYTFVSRGTSWATPMVAATYGMVKKTLESEGLTNLSASQMSNILFAGANVGRYTSGYTSSPETKFIGTNLISNYDAGNTRMIGLKTLNAYNAIKIAQNINDYDSLVRISNTDDFTWSTVNSDWGSTERIEESYLQDAIWGISGTNANDFVNLATYNSGGGYAYNYNTMELEYGVLFSNSFENAGVAGVTGAEGNIAKPTGWHAYYSDVITHN